MAITLEPMDAAAVAADREVAFERFLAARIEAGEQPAEARRAADQVYAKLYDGDRPAPGHRHYWLCEDDRRVGHLWIGPPTDGTPGLAWVYYVEVDESLRGRGLGRAAMVLAEKDAAAHGATELGLNVFGYNTTARSLYTSLGFTEVAVIMRKAIAGPKAAV